MVDGRHTYQISSYCTGGPTANVSVSTTSADVDEGGGKFVPQLAEPVTEGAQFQSIAGPTTWHFEGTVSVPAGTFQQCWRTTSGATFVVYCPGAGTVHIHDVQGSAQIDAVLSAKNF
jgi:hypothetical protein